MKKLLLSLLVAGFLSAPVFAQQEQQDVKKDQAEWEKKIKDELKLSEEQAIKYDALSKEYGDKINALKQDATLSADAQKQRKMELKKEKEAKLAEFLSTEQQAKYRELTDRKKKDKPGKTGS